jgi:hypothetical protein
MLAESEILEYLYGSDEYPDKVNFVKERDVSVNGEKKKIFVFTYGYGDEEEVYTAVAGPYAIKSKEFKRGDLTTFFYEEYKTDKELNKKLSEYLSENNAKLLQ